MLKGGHNKFWGSFDTLARIFSHTEWVGVGVGGGGRKTFPPFKRRVGREKFYLVLSVWGGGGGAQKVLDPQFSHIVAPLPCK